MSSEAALYSCKCCLVRHGPVHVLLGSAAEIGSAWDSDTSWMVPSWATLFELCGGPDETFSECGCACFERFMFLESCVRGKVSGVATLLITQLLCTSLTPHM